MNVSTNTLTVRDDGKPTFAAFGELKTLREWQRDPRCLVKAATLRRNIFAGLTLEASLQTEASESPLSIEHGSVQKASAKRAA